MANDFDLRPGALSAVDGTDGTDGTGSLDGTGGADEIDDVEAPAGTAAEGRPARPRTSSLLDDEQRAGFLAEWDSVQTGFVADPQRAAEAARRLVAELGESITRRIGEIVDAVGRPGADPSSTTADAGPAGVPVPDEETWRDHLLRCREAFHMLIDS